MTRPLVLAALLTAGSSLAMASDEPVAYRSTIGEAVVTRNFYTGELNWYFQPGGSSLTMTGYTLSPAGGTVSQVTVCLYNESAFTRSFTASAAVVQGSTTVQSITFSRGFASQRNTCHTLTGFNAVVLPGDFEIRASFNAFTSENLFAGFPATESGDIFDVAIGSQRPPFATGSQGPIRMNGVGLGYRITENDAPPPSCIPSNTAMCLANDRFKVEATYKTAQEEGQAKVVRLTPDTGYLWFFSDSNVEAVVKVLDACGLNQKFWVFAGGLTNQQTVITITDTETGAVKTYTNPLGTAFQPIQDTVAFSCQ